MQEPLFPDALPDTPEGDKWVIFSVFRPQLGTFMPYKTYLVANSGYNKEQLSNIAETICPNFREYEEKEIGKMFRYRMASHVITTDKTGFRILWHQIQKARKITCPVGEKNL